jgi:hypothetical protein
MQQRQMYGHNRWRRQQYANNNNMNMNNGFQGTAAWIGGTRLNLHELAVAAVKSQTKKLN